MWRRGGGLFQPAVKPRRSQVVKLGSPHRSVHLETRVHLRLGFAQPHWKGAGTPLFGAVPECLWVWAEGPDVAEDFPQ